MHFNKLAFVGAIAASYVAVATALWPLGPITATVGGTAFVLSASQAAIAASSIAGLAIAKEVIVLNELRRTRGRGRRDVDSVPSQVPVNFAPFFDAVAESDVAGCGKLLVCAAFAKNENALTSEEKLIKNLFDDLENIDPHTGYAEYQLAAYAGSFKHPELCVARYSSCPVTPENLADLVKVNEAAQNL